MDISSWWVYVHNTLEYGDTVNITLPCTRPSIIYLTIYCKAYLWVFASYLVVLEWKQIICILMHCENKGQQTAMKCPQPQGIIELICSALILQYTKVPCNLFLKHYHFWWRDMNTNTHRYIYYHYDYHLPL